MLISSRVMVRIRFRRSVWMVSSYAHACILLSVVIVTLPVDTLSLCSSEVADREEV